MPRGAAPGEYRGGRKKGVPNKKTAEVIKKVEQSGMLPLDYLLSVMRDEESTKGERVDAAKAAAPYIHPKLMSTELSAKAGNSVVLAVLSGV